MARGRVYLSEPLPTCLKTDDPTRMTDDHDPITDFDGCAGKSVPVPKSPNQFLGLIFVALTGLKTDLQPVFGRRVVHGRADFSMVVKQRLYGRGIF